MPKLKQLLLTIFTLLILFGCFSFPQNSAAQTKDFMSYIWVFKRTDLPESHIFSKIRFAVRFYPNGDALVMRKQSGGWATYICKTDARWSKNEDYFTVTFSDLDDLVVKGKISGTEIKNVSVTTTEYLPFEKEANQTDTVNIIPAPAGSKWTAFAMTECPKPASSGAISNKVMLNYMKSDGKGGLTITSDLHQTKLEDEIKCS